MRPPTTSPRMLWPAISSGILPAMVSLLLLTGMMSFPACEAVHADTPIGTYATDAEPLVGRISGGPLRVLYVGERSFVTALNTAVAARMDTDHAAFVTSGRNSFPESGRDAYGADFGELVSQEWDAVWLGLNPSAMPASARESLLDMVSHGAGLVYEGTKRDLEEYVTGDVDERRFRAAFDNSVRTETAGRRGEGVMVAVNPVAFGDRTGDERYLFATIHALMEASRRRSGLSVTGIRFAGDQVEQESMNMMNFRIDMVNTGSPGQMDVRQRYIDRYGRVAFEKTERFNIAGGLSFMLLDYPRLPAGEYSFELVLADETGAASVGGATFEVTSETRIARLYPWYVSVPNNEYIPCTVELSTTILADMRFEAELVDMHGRIIDQGTPEAVPGWKSSNFTLRASDIPGRMATIRVYYFRGSLLVDVMEAPVFIENHYNPRDFSLVVDDRGVSPLFRTGSLERLADAGAAWIVADMSGLSPGYQFSRGAEILRAGAGIIPSFGELSTVTPDTVYASADTLRHFTPPAYMLAGDNDGADSELPPRFDEIQAALVAADSTARAGMSAVGFRSAGDVARVTRDSDLVLAAEPPGGDIAGISLLAAIDSLAWPDAITGTVLHLPEGDAPEVRALPWINLFAGLNCIRLTPGDNGGGSLFMPDGGLSPPAAAVMKETGEIGGGIGRLLLGSDPVKAEWLAVSGEPEITDRLIARTFRDGNAFYVGMLLMPEDIAVNPPARLDVDVSGHDAVPSIYNVRSGDFLGVTRTAPLDIQPGEPVVLAFLPEVVRDITLTTPNQIVSPGGMVPFRFSVATRDGAPAAERHVGRLEFTDPDGDARPELTKLVETDDGAGEVSVFIAANDPAGQWTVTLTDIATGRTVERRFIVRRTATPGGM